VVRQQFDTTNGGCECGYECGDGGRYDG
jgi:hypothetical protein